MRLKLAHIKEVLLVSFLLISAASSFGQSIVGTKHDLSGKGWGSTEICVFCHTPHNAMSTQLVPLWNHATTTQSFTVYTSSTLNASGLSVSGVTKACMSCHDGVTAVDSYGSRNGTSAMTGTAALGIDLRNDHPVGFTYDGALATADGGLATPSSAAWVDAGHTVPLYGAKLECGSCHNVHSNANSPFLRKANDTSALCLTCHSK